MKQRIVFVMCLCFLLMNGVLAQTKSLKGTVKDKLGESIIGASVLIEGTSQGTITDLDGNYVIENIPAGKNVLVVSYVGYQTQKLEINGRSVIDIILQEDTEVLDEVVVVGYGVQRKTDVTSAVASIKKENFTQAVTSSSPLQMVQGKIPGLAMSRAGGGDPTSDMTLQIRGMSTINAGASPLIVIDGIPGGSMSTVSPNDIESIDVLRDGSAAAIYGSRGTSGVIIITTKKGVADGKTKIEYDGNVSFDQVSSTWDLLSGDEYRSLKESMMNSSIKLAQEKGQAMVDYGGNTDWMKEITRTAVSHQHYLSLNTSSKHSRTAASLTYNNYQGIVATSGKEEINGRISTEFKHFNDNLKVNLNLAYTSKTQVPIEKLALRQALIWNPTMTPYQEDGSYTPGADPLIYNNPVNLINETRREDKYNTLMGNAKITITPFKGMTLTGMIGLDRTESSLAWYKTSKHEEMMMKGKSGEAYKKSALNETRTLELTAGYNRQLIDDLNFDIMGGYSYQEFINEYLDATNYDFKFDDNGYNSIGSGAALKNGQASLDSYKGSSKLIAFFGRVVFNYKDKYLFNATVRHEGSSRFGKNHQWGTFPAASVAWRIINEPFMKEQKVFSDLKLRLGYGVTGNMIDQAYLNYVLFASQPIYAHNGSTSGNAYEPTYAPKTNANPDLKWETKKEFNVGLDMAFLGGRLNANIDIYQRKSEDLLYKYNVPVPPYLASEMWGNIGTISNKGVEIGINATLIQKKDFSWSMNFNGSYNKNNVEKLTTADGDVQERYELNLASPMNGHWVVVTKVDAPIGNFWGFKYAGVNENGETMVYQLNEDKSIAMGEDGKPLTLRWLDAKGSEDNKTIIGNGMPKYYANMSHQFRYKNFDFSFLLRGVFGFDILNLGSAYQGSPTFNRVDNVLKSALTSPIYDEPSITDAVVENGNFVKLDNITLGYNFPIKNNKFISSLRLYGSVQNVATFTSYSGQNPELEINGTVVGVDNMDAYPVARTYSLGVKISF